MKVKLFYDVFKDVWRSGFYTISTDKGYITLPTKKECNIYLKNLKEVKIK